MVTTKDKYPCPVCGVMISAQGVAGHNKSKVLIEALEKQKQVQQAPNQDIQQTKPEPTTTNKPEIKPEVKQTKTESVNNKQPQEHKN